MAFYLGIDYGTSSTGIAVGQDEIFTSQPLISLKVKDGKINRDGLDQCFNEWQPKAIVVGLPRNQDGSDSPMTIKVKKFAGWLCRIYQVPIYLIDERNTTTSAKEIIFSKHQSKGLQKGKIDKVSAAIILQAYFDGEDIAGEYLPQGK